MVTLFGTIVREIDARICMRVDACQGDAPNYGLGGEIWLARHQCVGGIFEAQSAGELDRVVITEAVAKAKAICQPPLNTQGRR